MTCLDFDIPAFDTSLQGEIQYSVGRQAVLNKSKKTLGILSNHMQSYCCRKQKGVFKKQDKSTIKVMMGLAPTSLFSIFVKISNHLSEKVKSANISPL